ncbi:MAG: cyclodeaminase/cyclohydrolase family protein [Candidatus Gygaella obscura]|nr:cyclodeaminase/cyclohydrolase family protein [Candidatus Gygaella obscura]
MYLQKSLKKYIEDLSSRKSTPGGGSAAALTACLGVGCIAMAAHYSIGNNENKKNHPEIKVIVKKLEKIKKRLEKLVDLDILVYKKYSQSRNKPQGIRRVLLEKAAAVPKEVCQLCYEALLLAPVLTRKGNFNLISDVEVGVELLEAAFKSGLINVRINNEIA